MENMKRKIVMITFVWVFLLAFSVPVTADIHKEWDWIGDPPSRNIMVRFDSSVDKDPRWYGWVRAAYDKWNKADEAGGGTGWHFYEEPGPIPVTGVTIYLQDLHPRRGRRAVAECDTRARDSKGHVSWVGITFDLDPSDTWTGVNDWDIAGANKLDPIYAAMHELGHALRLKHRMVQPDVMSYYGTAAETHNIKQPSWNDIAEAKWACLSTNTTTLPPGDVTLCRLVPGPNGAPVWQFTVKQENCNVIWTGWLTDEFGYPIAGSDFLVDCICTQMQCDVVKIPPNCSVFDIHYDLLIYSKEGPLLQEHHVDEDIPQFPWKWKKVDYDPVTGKWYEVELELDEVLMNRYTVMGGETDSAGYLTLGNARWSIGDWQYGAGAPFATRRPYLTPMLMGYNITFTDKDLVTGIVKLSVPAESYVGYSHVWYGNDSKLWYNMSITMEEQGCGWIFTCEGVDPILGDVDLITFNNYTGVYSLKLGWAPTLLAGRIDPTHPAYPAAGAGPPLGPCLEAISGPDGIPGTYDDPIGDGTPDPNGSSILYLPTTMTTYYWDTAGTPNRWEPLFSSPWPQLLTTGNATDVVIEPDSPIDGESASVIGHPWEFFAGLDHPGSDEIPHTGDTGEYEVYWNHLKCNAYVTYACAWSVLGTMTALGRLDVLFYTVQKLVRGDCVVMDISGDEYVDIEDIVTCAVAFEGRDEGRYWDESGQVWKWRRYATPPRAIETIGAADVAEPRGEIDIGDIVTIAIDFGAKLTPECILGRR